MLRAGIGKKQRKAVGDQLAAIPAGEGRVILATGKHVGEGFDDQRLDTLFLTLPVSWRGTVAQYAGRLHRLYDGKREVRIYDYADVNVPMLGRMFDRRCCGYEAIGYSVRLPASAIPGWPTDVILPSDPVWKRDYSGSVRRLVRDGVDAPLANLFVCAARPVSLDADGLAVLDAILRAMSRLGGSPSVPIAVTRRSWRACNGHMHTTQVMGGHHVPDEIVRRRYFAGIRNFFRLYQPLSTTWAMYNNSGARPVPVAEGLASETMGVYDGEVWEAVKRQGTT